jgi:HlyD family secretion protein
VDAYLDNEFKGVVTEMASSAANTSGVQTLNSDQVTNFVVKIRILPESYTKLSQTRMPFRPGMSATVDINTHTERNTISIPIQSVTTRENKKSKEEDDQMGSSNTSSDEDTIDEVVFVYEADTARMIKVETGIQDNEYIQVLSGLEVDQEVITGPYSTVSRKLKDGLILEKKEERKESK